MLATSVISIVSNNELLFLAVADIHYDFSNTKDIRSSWNSILITFGWIVFVQKSNKDFAQTQSTNSTIVTINLIYLLHEDTQLGAVW